MGRRRRTGSAASVVVIAIIAAAVVWGVSRQGADDQLESPPAGSSAAVQAAPGIPPEAFQITVESVHDGDTLRALNAVPNEVMPDAGSTRIRLIGLDTPEIAPDVECWGGEATARLTALAPPGSTLWAAPDREALDQYGRNLMYLWTTDGTFVNAELLAGGNARVMIYAPNDLHEDLFRSLESQAAAQSLGLWSACG